MAILGLVIYLIPALNTQITFKLLKIVDVFTNMYSKCVYLHGVHGTAEVAVHLIPLLHPCGVLLIENGQEYHQWGKHPQERDQVPPP